MKQLSIRIARAGAAVAAFALVSFFLAPGPADALPRFALQSGQRCSSCHINISGGGQRTEGGWWSMKEVGLIKPEGTFLEPLYKAEDNTLFTPQVSWGFDYRLQMAKRQNANRELERKFFSMQLAPYLSYKPVEEVTIYAAYNFIKPEYPTQQKGFGGVTYTPMDELTVKAGFIQPNIGVRHDDHTTFTRIHGGLGLFPYYAELGGEVYVTPLEWLNVSAGAYSSKNRNEYVSAIPKDAMFFTGNIDAIYQDEEMGLNYRLGGTAAMFENQSLMGGHLGVGWMENGMILFEYLQRADDFTRLTNPSVSTSPAYKQSAAVLLVKASYEIIEGLSFVGRWEQARTDNMEFSDGAEDGHSFERSWVAGLQVFVLPNLEIRPEYRWTDTPFYTVSQWTAQLHLFY